MIDQGIYDALRFCVIPVIVLLFIIIPLNWIQHLDARIVSGKIPLPETIASWLINLFRTIKNFFKFRKN